MRMSRDCDILAVGNRRNHVNTTVADWKKSYQEALRNLTEEDQRRVESMTFLTSPQQGHARRCYENLRATLAASGEMQTKVHTRL